MSNTANRRPVPSGRGVGFVKFATVGDHVMGIHRETFQLEDNGKVRDNIVLEVTQISAKVFNHGKEIAIETGDFICVGMGPKALNGRTKFLTEGTTYGVKYLGEGTAKQTGHNTPKFFDMYEVLDDEPSKEASDDTVVGSGTGENGNGYVDETDDGEPPF